MRISLVRSGLQPDHLQDQGEHYFTYSLLPHGGDFVEGKTVQSAYQLNNSAKVVKGACKLGFDGMFTLDKLSLCAFYLFCVCFILKKYEKQEE